MEHGANGKKNKTLFLDDDLSRMYRHYKQRHNILLWCFKHSEADRDIVKKLQDKHIYSASISVEKYNAWAHMIHMHNGHMDKHTSYEDPSDLPLLQRLIKVFKRIAYTCRKGTCPAATCCYSDWSVTIVSIFLCDLSC